MKSDSSFKTITLISGGVGGAKLARGFVRAFPGTRINIITNTADDTEFYGLHVSPDLDTMMYNLAGLTGAEHGWGIGGDSFQSLSQLRQYGEPAWFKLGDRDLATHILRTKMLREGKTLTQVTSCLSRKLGIRAGILPMTNGKVATFVKTDDGMLPFQEYFVLNQKRVNIRQVVFRGIRRAHPTKEVMKAIGHAGLIVFAPSNPIVSILPVLILPGIRRSIATSRAPKIAVSPFIGQMAISGPAKELMECKGFAGSSTGVAHFYAGLIDRLVIDYQDETEKNEIEQSGVTATVTNTLMKDIDDSIRLAREICANHG